MKVIFSIAKNEFRYLFYSPIAWFVLLVFLVQCAYFYTVPVYGTANYLEIMLKNAPAFKGVNYSLTANLFLDTEFFPNIIRNLFLFIPILTMGLINRETNNGTSALLYSAPISIRRIVLGKYIGIMMYNLLLVLIIAIFLVAGMLNIKSADYGALLSALLGFYLLVCTYSAIGMFMSSLSSYQIVSALGTFTLLFVLSQIGKLWQRHDLVRDLTWFLSLQDRTLKMLHGLIVTKDVIYFILVSLMFIVFTYFRLSGKLEFRPWYVKAGKNLATVGLVLLIGYISSRPAVTGYLDTTYVKRNTIHPNAQQILREFGDSTLEVTLYTNLLGGGIMKGLPEGRNVDYLAKLWEPYLRFKPDIQFRYVYYFGNDPAKDDSSMYRTFPGKINLEEIANEFCNLLDYDPALFKPANQVPIDAGLRDENYRLVMQLKYQGRTAFLRTFEDPIFWPDQTNVTAALKRVLGDKIPAIAYATGSYERNAFKTGEREYALHSTSKDNRGSLVNIGFDADSINLHTQQIPANTTALVITDPKMELSPIVREKIDQYISKGGNLMIHGEPGKQYVLNPLLSQIGVQLENGQLVYPTYDETPDKVVAFLTRNSGELSKTLAPIKEKVPFDTARILMPGATQVSRLANPEWQTDSLALTMPNKSWLKKGAVVIDSILPPFNPLEGDTRLSSFTTMQRLQRKINGKEQRVFVAGDADFASNLRFSSHVYFLVPVYSWMADNRFPILTMGKAPKDILMNIGERAGHYQKIVFIWVLPALILIAGTVLLIRRKRK